MDHSVRKHSKFSASGAERWHNCSGSVALSEGIPSRDSVWSLEGTRAHEVLEVILRMHIGEGTRDANIKLSGTPREMYAHSENAAKFIYGLHQKLPGSDILVETRIHLDFIHPEMFGTFDGAVVDHFGTLHIFDYKYGAGVAVSPTNNLQMIFYGIGLAAKHDWNFKRVRLWIIQPRIKGYSGPLYWELTAEELKRYVWQFVQAVMRVKNEPDNFVEGGWCHWCPAKGICPLKTEARTAKAMSVFTASPFK